MEKENVHFRSSTLYKFYQGSSTTDAVQNICSVFGVGCIFVRTYQRWYLMLSSGDKELKNKERSGRPQTIDDEVLKGYVDNYPRHTSQMFTKHFEVSHTTILNSLSRLKIISKLDVWIPHE